ncbi:uncharacterized protein IL334_002072 [Kwoniella shivajii]|uniref:Bromodomain associated domain-containing protein n=1 Tax=Kwoniella shivajii TaxID=564305 RepID=A0ABZ1CU17_9TREE|nr:hypothetical protein IL334_002072 [Kwoniella shivajii]
MSTLRSLPTATSSKYVPPDAPQAYLRQVVVHMLLKRGFEGAEAGALAEIERLLEHHITNTFEDSVEYAHLSARKDVNAIDLLSAQENSGWGVKRMKRESKRKRGKALSIHFNPSPPPSPTLQSLSSIIQDDYEPSDNQYQDLKPDVSNIHTVKGRKLPYGQDWTPILPDKWTLISPSSDDDIVKDETHDQPVQVTSALLDFIKLTATERGDIPPELGVVDYRRAGTKDDASMSNQQGNVRGKAGKRKWGVKGVSVK